MTQDRVMLLIDADNVSVDVMEQAVRLLMNQHGALHVRRAYCTAEGALKHQSAFKRLGIKPMVNLAAGKNSTDIALAVDAIDLVLAERPDVVVIASSDSDFAPLVQRLREKGCVVRGIGQQGKTGDETQDVYDDFTVLEHRKPSGAASPSAAARDLVPTRPARKTAARKVAGKEANNEVGKQTGKQARLAGVGATDTAAGKAVEPSARTSAKTAAKTPARTAAKPAARKAAAKSPPSGLPGTTDRADTANDGVEAAARSTPKAPHKAARGRKRAATQDAPAEDASVPDANFAGGIADGGSDGGSDGIPLDIPAAAAKAPAPARSRSSDTAAKTSSVGSATPAAPARAATQAAAASAPARELPLHERARQILACMPELERGETLELRVASQRLREAGLMGRSGASTKLLGQFPELFELVPPGQPNHLRLRR